MIKSIFSEFISISKISFAIDLYSKIQVIYSQWITFFATQLCLCHLCAFVYYTTDCFILMECLCWLFRCVLTVLVLIIFIGIYSINAFLFSNMKLCPYHLIIMFFLKFLPICFSYCFISIYSICWFHICLLINSAAPSGSHNQCLIMT